MSEPYLRPATVRTTQLTGQLLVANPHLQDSNFSKSVVYLLEHSPEGALGVILNRPSLVAVGEILPQWEVFGAQEVIYHGGPVGTNCALGLAVATGNCQPVGWQSLNGSIGLIDLDTPAEGVQNQLSGLRIFAGYSGWEAGQLEAEIGDDAWFTVDAYPQDLLVENASNLWRAVLRRQTSELVYLSTFTEDPTLN